MKYVLTNITIHFLIDSMMTETNGRSYSLFPAILSKRTYSSSGTIKGILNKLELGECIMVSDQQKHSNL
jgi:hypothetical protein